MQYRNFGKTGISISSLGIGTKRLPTTIDGNGRISVDKDKSTEIIRKAIDSGINYIDSAYSYYDGEAEKMLGSALMNGYREKVYIATKCPLWLIKSPEDFDRILDEQLERLQVDYIDFYMFHSMNSINWNDVVLTYRLLDKMDEAKKSGKIRFVGFSYHDNYDMFETALRIYDWDFCQIQMNYLNYDKEATFEGMQLAYSKGIGIVVMEVLAEGKLANPPVNVANTLWDMKSAVEWAYDYVWDKVAVSVALTGVNNLEHLQENIIYANRSYTGMLFPKEELMFLTAKEIYDTIPLVNCNKCSYCMPCPRGINIPRVFDAYNQLAIKGKEEALKLYSTNKIKANQCSGCKTCEKACPNRVKISEQMKQIDKIFSEIV